MMGIYTTFQPPGKVCSSAQYLKSGTEIEVNWKEQSEMGTRILTCVYCGHEYPQETPAWNDKVLTDHIADCEKHPMRAVIRERDRLRSALVGLLGEGDPEALRSMELLIRQDSSAPDADRAVAINAIHALLNDDDQCQRAKK
jgi:hypothetical protein